MFHERLKHREDLLARKVEELREWDEDLVKAIARNSELEAFLNVKEDELDFSRGVVTENADLHAKVDGLIAVLNTKSAKVIEIKSEMNVGVDRFEATISEAAISEDALHTSRSEWAKEEEVYALKVARLEGCIKELEAELSVLTGKVSLLRMEDASRHQQPSTSRTLAEPILPRHSYKLWFYVEARQGYLC